MVKLLILSFSFLLLLCGHPVEALTRTNGVNQAFTAWTPGTPITVNLGFTATIGRVLVVSLIDHDIDLTYTLSGRGTWTTVISFNGTNVGELSVFITKVTSSGTSFTIDASDNGTASGGHIVVTEFDELSDPLVTSTATASQSSTTPTCGPVTTTVNPSLLMGLMVGSGGQNPTVDATFTTEYDAGTDFIVGYRIVTTPTTYSWSPTSDLADDQGLLLVAIDGITAGGGSTSNNRMMLIGVGK